MSATEALGIAAGIVFVLALNAIGQERDHIARMDDRCAAYGKAYSATHRACVRPPR